MKQRITVFLVAVTAMLGVDVFATTSASATTTSLSCYRRSSPRTYVREEQATYHVGSSSSGTSKAIMDIQWSNFFKPVVYIQVMEGYKDSSGTFISRYKFDSTDGGHVSGSRVTDLPLISPTYGNRWGYLRLVVPDPTYQYIDCERYVIF